jgi:hypothetical protein
LSKFPEKRIPESILNLSPENYIWEKSTSTIWKINNPKQKLTIEQVKEIKDLIKKEDSTLTEIGKRYNVCCSSISSIKLGKSWKTL